MKVEITHHITLPEAAESLALWVPVPATTGYQRVTALKHEGDFAEAGIFTESVYGAPVVHGRWRQTGANSGIRVTAVVETWDWDSALAPTGDADEIPEAAAMFLAPTAHVPTEGVVRQRAEEITRGKTGAVERARALYDWVIENTHRNFEVAWCGTGDVGAMLASGKPCGKCVDINSLLVALARAAGIPARGAFGVRAGPSRFGAALGRAGDISNAQHFRAELYFSGLGWRPLDPADVMKLQDEKLPSDVVRQAREYLFGRAEGNWVAYNHGRDFLLAPPPAGGPVNHFMYPLGEREGKPLTLKAGSPGYTISSVVHEAR